VNPVSFHRVVGAATNPSRDIVKVPEHLGGCGLRAGVGHKRLQVWGSCVTTVGPSRGGRLIHPWIRVKAGSGAPTRVALIAESAFVFADRQR
jgi:hypothetical protein